jgi:hypothetical protein
MKLSVVACMLVLLAVENGRDKLGQRDHTCCVTALCVTVPFCTSA